MRLRASSLVCINSILDVRFRSLVLALGLSHGSGVRMRRLLVPVLFVPGIHCGFRRFGISLCRRRLVTRSPGIKSVNNRRIIPASLIELDKPLHICIPFKHIVCRCFPLVWVLFVSRSLGVKVFGLPFPTRCAETPATTSFQPREDSLHQLS